MSNAASSPVAIPQGGAPHPFQAGRSRTASLDIAYLRRVGTGPSIVGLHGLFGSGACLLPLVEGLASDADVVLPDSRGHGATGAPPEGYLYPDLARDVLDLVDGLVLQRPILLGHSMGGMTATLAAAELGERLGGLILVDPTFLDPDYQREVFESGVAQDHLQQLQVSRENLLARAAARSPRRPLGLREALVDARLRTHVRAADVLTPPNPDFFPLVARLAAPTLLVSGSSGIVSVELAKALERANPFLVHRHLEGAGHGMPYDAPDEVAALIGEFLNESVNRERA